MPEFHSHIIDLRSNGSTPTIGVGAYSEGISDDLNKAIWSAMGQDVAVTWTSVLADYARTFFPKVAASTMETLLRGLENNFRGPIEHNLSIQKILELALNILKMPDAIKNNWRLQMYVYRAVYDGFIQVRYMKESSWYRKALYTLAQAETEGASKSLESALELLARQYEDSSLEKHITDLANLMNLTVGAEVIQNQDTQLNLKSLHASITDKEFVAKVLNNISSLSSEEQQLRSIAEFLNSQRCPASCFCDNLGSTLPVDRPHLDLGQGVESDPSNYFTPLVTGTTAYHSVSKNWSRSTVIFYDNWLKLHYQNLSASVQYQFEAVVVPTSSNPAISLMADDLTLLSAFQATDPPSKVVVKIPRNCTSDAALTLACHLTDVGGGNNGRGCSLSVTRLSPIP